MDDPSSADVAVPVERRRVVTGHRDALRGGYLSFLAQIAGMWETEPDISDAELATISMPVTVAIGQCDEGIDRRHAQDVANAIPNANPMVLPDVRSHLR